ncbi:hypothetical protein ACFLT3_01650 [Chloroflexota bacterium]
MAAALPSVTTRVGSAYHPVPTDIARIDWCFNPLAKWMGKKGTTYFKSSF